MQIGKDYKIYISDYSETNLSVINSPNLLGTACNLTFRSLSLPGTCWLGLPSFAESDFNTSTPCVFPRVYAHSIGLNCNNDSTGKAWVSLLNMNAHTTSWTPGGMTTDTIKHLAAGTYYSFVTDSVGTIYQDTMVITEPPALFASVITPNDTVCPATPITFTGSGVGGIGGTFTYLWSSASGVGSSITYTYTPPATGDTVSLTVTDLNGCTADTALMITILPPKDPTINAVPVQCLSASPITLVAASTGGTWTGVGITDAVNGIFSPATAGVGAHVITYSLTTPCLSVDTVTINVVRQLSATITHAGPFCLNDAAITLVAVDSDGVWTGTGITNASTGAFDPLTAGVGSHTITYTINTLCGDSASTVINVIASPVISFSADTTQGCEPTSITFTGVTDQPGGTSAWDFGDGNIDTILSPVNLYATANTYTVTFTYSNSTGCSTTAIQTDLIMVHSQPGALFEANPQPATIVNPEIHFTDHSTGSIDTWKWSFGTGDSSNIQSPTYNYTGSFPIKLIVTNNFGCTDTATGNVVINQILLLYAPNAFTPDGNGINDEFMVKGTNINPGTFEMRIFDRWGEQVFRTHDMNRGWNGAMDNIGELLKLDEYVWKVDFKDFSDTKRSYLGRVSLIR